jgi:alkyl hydroperoxide reductase subunit AhpC
VIGPDKQVTLILVYPMSAGRNFDEILRVIDALQLNAKQNLATPADWRPGQAAIIPTSVKDEDAKKLFPQGWKTLKPYLRIVQPK